MTWWTTSGSYTRFDPRPHARGDARHRVRLHPTIVSIHAPTRGATRSLRNLRYSSMFRSTPPREGRPGTMTLRLTHSRFRSTPAREGRPQAAASRLESLCFDPRPHARGDDQMIDCRQRVGVSIHAPTRGATPLPIASVENSSFRSTPPREGRPAVSDMSSSLLLFRSTPPREGRRWIRRPIPIIGRVSIHAPTRGATRDAVGRRVIGHVSIHAPTRGATPQG